MNELKKNCFQRRNLRRLIHLKVWMPVRNDVFARSFGKSMDIHVARKRSQQLCFEIFTQRVRPKFLLMNFNSSPVFRPTDATILVMLAVHHNLVNQLQEWQSIFTHGYFLLWRRKGLAPPAALV
jgi:hypothetical protein